MAMWLPFMLLSLTIELTPGPNMAYLALLSVSVSRRSGMMAVAGIALGLAMIGSLAAFGAAAIISNSTWFSQILAAAGCLYLLWLAWCSWNDEVASPTHQKLTHGKYFMRGLITNLLNPKAFAFYVLLLPGFIGSNANPTDAALALTAISVAIATTVHVGIILLGNQLKPYLDRPQRHRILRKTMALMLVAIALWFAYTNASLIFKKVA